MNFQKLSDLLVSDLSDVYFIDKSFKYWLISKSNCKVNEHKHMLNWLLIQHRVIICNESV